MHGTFNDTTAFTALQLPERHKLARETIDHYTSEHIWTDIVLGLVGLIPVPGASVVTLGASVAAQGPLIYHPMARKLAAIYTAPPNELMELQLDLMPKQMVQNALLDITADFTVEFLVSASAAEIAAATAGGFVPVVGGIIGAVFDYKIAKKMTKRIGRMVALYYMNGARWKNDSFQQTYEEAKREAKGDLSNIPEKNPDVHRTMMARLVTIIKMVSPSMNKEQIKQMLRSQQVPDDWIEQAIRMAQM